MTTTAPPPFPFRALLHVPTVRDYVRIPDEGRRAKVTAGSLARAERALRWHERRARTQQQQERPRRD